VHYTKLYFCLRKDALNGFGKALQVVNRGDKNIFDTPVLKIGKHLQPEFGTFILPDIHAQQLFKSFLV
jgi:hypothetical protein